MEIERVKFWERIGERRGVKATFFSESIYGSQFVYCDVWVEQ